VRGIVPALAKVRGSAPLDRVRFAWGAGFDPRVGSGVSAPPGSVGICIDGSAAYLKADAGAQQWIYLRELSSALAFVISQSPALQRLIAINPGSLAPADMASALYLETVLRDIVWGRPLQMIFNCGVPADYTDGQTVIVRLPVMPSRAPETVELIVQVAGPVTPGPGQVLVDLSAVPAGNRDLTAQVFRTALYIDWWGLHFGNPYPIDPVTQRLTMYSAACGKDLNDGTWGKIGGTAAGFLVLYQQGATSALEAILTEVDSLYLSALDYDAGARGLTQVSGTIPGNPAIWDLSALACETKGSFELAVTLVVAGAGTPSHGQLRVNGSGSAGLQFQRLYSYGFGVGADAFGYLNGAGNLAAGQVVQFRVSCAQPRVAVGSRVLAVSGLSTGTLLRYDFVGVLDSAAGEIDSVGAGFTGGPVIDSALSSWVLTRRIAP
jgi:hypothetical protein